jgi:hypothetical protein
MARIAATLFTIFLLSIGSAFAQGSCATQAVSKDGKPLSGAARTSAIKKCCNQAAVSTDGKPLSGSPIWILQRKNPRERRSCS